MCDYHTEKKQNFIQVHCNRVSIIFVVLKLLFFQKLWQTLLFISAAIYFFTMVGRQAVHESFIIVDALSIWTQGVKLSWVEKVSRIKKTKQKQDVQQKHGAFVLVH